VRKLGRGDELFELKTSPQARKQWPALPGRFTARLLTRTVDGKEKQVLTSLTDQNRYPGNDISELYRHRWEIELGYREAKQGMMDNRWTLRSKLPELVRQECTADLQPGEIPDGKDGVRTEGRLSALPAEL